MSDIAKMVYKFYYLFVFIPLQIVLILISAIIILLLFPVINPDWVSYYVGIFLGRSITWASLSTAKVVGAEKLEKGKSYIFVANHSSSFDVFLILGWIGHNIRWVMKKELTKIPVFGWAARVSGQIAVDRSDSQAAIDSINAARSQLTKGVSVIFFPEGTRSRTGRLQPFKKGAYHFAFDMDFDVVPVAIKGAYKVKTPGKFFGSPGKIELIIHEPVKIAQHSREEMRLLIDETRNKIAESLGEPS